MRLATFNVNSIRARLDILLGWLARARPDVACLQETKTPDDTFPLEAVRAAGYETVFRGEKGYNGVAILSRARAADVRFGLDDGGPADEARLVAARFGRVHVVNTYVPQGRELDHPMFQYKLEWFGRLRRYFERHYTPRQSVVWAGDLNLAPAAMDIHNAEQQADHVCYHVSVREAFARTVAWGFEDVFRRHHPEEPGQYTFFDYRQRDAVGRNLGWRVDHILATPRLAAKSTGAFIEVALRKLPKASDHTALVADFDV
jgi:exodeoxyribonuclease-3